MLEIICLFSNFPSAYNMLFPKIRFLLCYYWFLFCFISSQKTPEPRNISPTALASPRNCFPSLPIPSRMEPIFPYLVSEMFLQRASLKLFISLLKVYRMIFKEKLWQFCFRSFAYERLTFCRKKGKLMVEVHLVVRWFSFFSENKIFICSV